MQPSWATCDSWSLQSKTLSQRSSRYGRRFTREIAEGTKVAEKIHNEGTKSTKAHEEEGGSRPSSAHRILTLAPDGREPPFLRSSPLASFLRCESSSFPPSPPDAAHTPIAIATTIATAPNSMSAANSGTLNFSQSPYFTPAAAVTAISAPLVGVSSSVNPAPYW